jgi:hypothetical protein
MAVKVPATSGLVKPQANHRLFPQSFEEPIPVFPNTVDDEESEALTTRIFEALIVDTMMLERRIKTRSEIKRFFLK